MSFRLRQPPPATSTLLPYPTLFRSRPTPLTAPAPRNRADARRTRPGGAGAGAAGRGAAGAVAAGRRPARAGRVDGGGAPGGLCRSEEHTSELQSREKLVCRRLVEKK